jgi:nucleoside-diphosphate-sugar epimerase
MQFVNVKDIVYACLKVLDVPDAEGHAFNVANSKALTQVETVEAIAHAAGKEPRFVRIPRERILRAGGGAMGPKLYFGMYYDVPPITMAANKAQRVLKLKPTEFETGLKEEYRWYIRKKPFPKPDYSFEDALIAAAPPSAYLAPED